MKLVKVNPKNGNVAIYYDGKNYIDIIEALKMHTIFEINFMCKKDVDSTLFIELDRQEDVKVIPNVWIVLSLEHNILKTYTHDEFERCFVVIK